MVKKMSMTIIFLTAIVAMATFQPKEKAVIRNPFVVEVPNLIEIYEKNHKKITTSAGALQIEGQQSLSSAIVSVNPQDMVAAIPEQNYSDEDLYWLSRLIQAEA